MNLLYKAIKKLIVQALKKTIVAVLLQNEQEYHIVKRIEYVPSFRIDGRR